MASGSEPAGPAVADAPRAAHLDLGGRTYDIGQRALVMGILNRTPDSFYDKGATYGLDALWRGPSSWWPRGPTSSTWAGSRPVPGRR